MGILCVLGVGVSVFSLIFVMNIMDGFQKRNIKRLLNIKPHVILPDASLKDWKKALQNPKISSHLLDWSPYKKQELLLKTHEGRTKGVLIKGLDSSYLKNLFLDSDTLTSGDSPGIILGGILGQELNLIEGDKVVLFPPQNFLMPSSEWSFKEVKISSFAFTQLSEIDSHQGFYDQERFLLNWRESLHTEEGIELRLKNIYDFNILKENLKPYYNDIKTWKENDALYFASLRLEKLMVSFLLSLALFIACFGVMSVIYFLLNQKEKEIEILKVMGLSKKEVRLLFLKIGVSLSGVGVFLGFSLSLGASYLLKAFPLKIFPDFYYDVYLPVEIKPFQMLWVFLGLVTVCFLSSYLPLSFFSWKKPGDFLKSSRS